MQPGVDIAGQSCFAVSHEKLGIIDPIVQNGTRSKPAADLPFRESGDGCEPLPAIDRMIGNELQDAEQ